MRPRLRETAGLVALAVLAAACGGDGPTGAAATGPAPPAGATGTTTVVTRSTAVVEDRGPAPTTSTSIPPSTVDPDDPASVDPDQLDLPADSAEMTAALGRAERAVRRSDLSLDRLDAWGRRQQALYRQLAVHEDWADEVLASVDPAVAEAVALNWEARLNLTALLATEELHHTVPAWRVVDPLAAETLLGYYKRAEAETGIPWEFVAGINLVETRMGRIQGVSTAGAVGPMQFLPTTWAECCEGDPSVPEDAIIGAATYLTHRGGPDDMAKALWGYNNSDYYVNAVTAYAKVLMADERAYYGYHAWEIYFLTTAGLVRLPVGYDQAEEVDAADWVRDNPELVLGR